MSRSLSSFILLCFLAASCRVRAQGSRECARLTKEDLISTNNPRQSSILVQTYNPNVNPTDPFIIVEDMHIVCEAVGTTRDTFRYVSVVVRQICIGLMCPAEQRDVSVEVQYDFECATNNVWIPETLGSTSVREDDPQANFDTETRCDCSACVRTVSGADPVTHCRPCASSCTEGAMKCDGFGSGCCTYYYENLCVEECPSDTQVVDEDFNCVEPVECPGLEAPVNGTVSLPDDRVYPGEATYECADGFELSGAATLKCEIEGDWSEDAPVCEAETTEPPDNEIFCKVENCLVCAATKCQQCETSYVLGADGLCVTKDTTATDSTTSSRDDSTREEGSEPGLTALEIAAIIAGLIIFLILLLTLFTCVSVIFTKRMCKKNDPEKVVKQEDVQRAMQRRANPAYVRSSYMEAQVTFGPEVATTEMIDTVGEGGEGEDVSGEDGGEETDEENNTVPLSEV